MANGTTPQPTSPSSPPPGYHEVSAPGGPPAGYHEVAAPAAPIDEVAARRLRGTHPDVRLWKAHQEEEAAHPPSKWEQLTAPDVTTQNPALNFVSNVARSILAFPEQMYHQLQDPMAAADQMGDQASDAFRFWMGNDPELRPSVKGVASVAPAALGQATGQTLAAKGMAKGLAGGIKLARMPSVESFAPPELAEATKAVKRTQAVKTGIAGEVNKYIRPVVAATDSAIETEVGKHASAVLQADKIDMAMRNGAKMVDTTGVNPAAQTAVHDIFGDQFTAPGATGSLMAEFLQGKMDMTSAKALTSEVGKMASRLEHGGARAQAAPLWAAYEELHKATLSRADDLGQAFKTSWQKYIDEYRSYHRGTVGEPGVAGMIDTLQRGDPEAAAGEFMKMRISKLVQAANRYGVDASTIQKAADELPRLQESLKNNQNIVVSKLRGIVKHPLLVGAPTLAGSVAGGALVPGLGHFVGGLMVAARVMRVIDNYDVASILKELQPKAPETGLQGPTPPATIPPGWRPPAAPPSGGAAPTGAAPPTVPPASAAAPTPLGAPGVSGAQQALEAAQETSELAGKLKRARRMKGKP